MDELLAAARTARANAYAPYSEYAVGAAVATPDGSVFTGCNVEVVNYSNALHAEEVAVGKAVSAGYRALDRVAVSGPGKTPLRPCGACRQTLAEFCDDDTPVVCDAGEDATPTRDTIGDLLPTAMRPTDLGVDRPTE